MKQSDHDIMPVRMPVTKSPGQKPYCIWIGRTKTRMLI